MLRNIILTLILILPAGASSAQQEAYVPRGPGTQSVMVGEGTIGSLALKDTEMAEAIATIAQKSGLNIVTGQNITGRVTVFLKNVSARDALRIVLESNGLAYAEEGNIIRVMTADEFLAKYGHAFGQDKASRLIKLNVLSPSDAQKFLEELKGPQGKIIVNEDARTVFLVDAIDKVRAMEAFLAELDVPTETRTLTLKNARAEILAPEVRRMLTQGIGSAGADAAANTLVVTDTAARLAKISRAVAAMDARGRVMVLEAKLVHIVLNDEHTDGVDWDGILEDAQRMRLSEAHDLLTAGDNGSALSFGMIDNEDFATLIEALDTVGVVQEYPLAAVRMTGEEEARLEVHLDDPSLEITADPVAGDEGAAEAGIADAGEPDGTTLAFNIRAAFDVTGEVVTSVAPALDAGRGNTVSAHEGYTAVIGGMVTTSTVSAAHKIPLLGDLPVLGFAFRLNGSVRKEEFVVFLTPRTVSLSQALADEGGAEIISGEGE